MNCGWRKRSSRNPPSTPGSVPGCSALRGLLAFLGAATVIAAAVAALSLVSAVWASALIVGAVLFVAAGVAALVGRRQAQEVMPAAPRTVETVKADIQELKDARHGTP